VFQYRVLKSFFDVFLDPFQIFDRDSGRDGAGRQNRISGDTEGENPETILRKEASFLPMKPFFPFFLEDGPLFCYCDVSFRRDSGEGPLQTMAILPITAGGGRQATGNIMRPVWKLCR